MRKALFNLRIPEETTANRFMKASLQEYPAPADEPGCSSEPVLKSLILNTLVR
jgi:hypothetical protein